MDEQQAIQRLITARAALLEMKTRAKAQALEVARAEGALDCIRQQQQQQQPDPLPGMRGPLE